MTFKTAWLAAMIALAVLPAARASAATDGEIKAEVNRQIARLDLGKAHVAVEVEGGVVKLAGDLPTYWTKYEVITRTLKVEGVKSVEADLAVPKAENDQALIREVGKRIRGYDRYGVYDNIEGRVLNGAVRLDGAVTEPKKSDDLFERVAKVKGVQSIDNKLVVLPANQSDDRLRVIIANAIYRDEAFVNYSMADPPIHVIVNNGHVTLVGFVRSQIERIKAESAARSVPGVLAFENRVEVVGPQAKN